MLNSPAFIRLRRRFAETSPISARQERLKAEVGSEHPTPNIESKTDAPAVRPYRK